MAARPAGGQRRLSRAGIRYYICLSLLLASAVGMQSAASYYKIYFRKEAVPLKRRFTELDWRKLASRYQPHPIQPRLLPPEQEEALGTEDYLELRLIDTEKPARDPAALANVFLTYYTGQPDMVPHVPDECYLAGGYERIGWATEELRVVGARAPDDRVPVRVVQFQSRSGSGEPISVIYFFSVNGEYRNGREGVRFRLARPFERYAYYCKIELSFTDNENPLRPRRADMQQSLAAAQDLLTKLLPVLIEDHIDWDPARNGPAQMDKRSG